MQSPTARPALWVATLSLPLLLAWDASPLDMQLAAWFGGPAGFPLKDDWLLSAVLHEGGRLAAWACVLVASLMVWWPLGVFKRIDVSRRLQLVVSALVAVLAVNVLKAFSNTSCPWDLAEFGRTARHVSHWAWAMFDGGSGRCFPAGHASAGFAFVAGYFAFAEAAPRAARAWLAVALAAGLLFGLAQQARGAHFMSHTLWTAWLCWCIALSADRLRDAYGPWQGAEFDAGVS
ncbi:MAG: phosphatase PAP2 family protein [Burkholderiaceae bacterium]